MTAHSEIGLVRIEVEVFRLSILLLSVISYERIDRERRRSILRDVTFFYIYSEPFSPSLALHSEPVYSFLT